MAKTTKTQRYLTTFFDEKGIDMDQSFEITSAGGVWNLMTYGVVVEAIQGAPEHEREAIANTIRRIDFKNGDIRHYLRHLAQALANSKDVA